MTQRQIAKQYSFLNGKEIKVYIGRVPCKMKHVEKELSIFEKKNIFGKYEPINIIIQKTHFNGKVLTITPKDFPYQGTLLPFKIKQKDIDKLQVL
jgi:hypothetical protein